MAIGVATYGSKTSGSSTTINSSSEPDGDALCSDGELSFGYKSGTIVEIGGTFVEIGFELIGSLIVGSTLENIRS